MPPGRLTFLYPHLLRAARTSVTPSSVTTRWVATTRSKSSFAPRHGKAVEPTWNKPQEEQQPQLTESTKESDAVDQEQEEKTAAETASTTPTDTKQPDAQPSSAEKLESPELEQPAVTESTTAPTEPVEPSAGQSEAAGASAAAPGSGKTVEKPVDISVNDDTSALPSLDAVLHMPSPDKVEHPHMTPPPYVHHFDSYSLVKQLEDGGYTKEQAVTSMKAIRKILAQNLDVAQKSLVSKSDVENVSVQSNPTGSMTKTDKFSRRRTSFKLPVQN